MSRRPFTSVLIPTRNRPELAALAVEAALHGCGPDDEVVLADNSDAPLALDASLAGDARLRRLPPETRPLSMPDNWERALRAARGEWTLLLADKYMLVPGALVRLHALLARAPRVPVATYGYAVLRQGLPSGEERDPRALRARGGELRLPANVARVQKVDARAAFARLYADVSYPRRSPMLYTALARRDVLDDGLRRGRFFVGSCPDVASAAQLLAACEAYLDTHLPLVLLQYPSESPAWSTGASTVAGGELSRRYFGELGDARARDSVERLVAGAILETLLAFARARPELGARVDWAEFAKQASREIEVLPIARRPGLHARLLRYTASHAGLRPRLAYVQARTAVASHLPRGLLARLLALRSRLFATPPTTDAELPVTSERVASRDEALRRAAACAAGA